MNWLRSFKLLALVAWVGGIAFLAFVEAPAAFQVLPDTQLAGSVVGRSLTVLHWIGIVSGGVFLAASLALNYSLNYRLRLFSASHILVIVMLVLTMISQFSVIPRMQALRGSLPGSVLPAEFERLHQWSTRLESGVLILGLVVVVLAARKEK